MLRKENIILFIITTLASFALSYVSLTFRVSAIEEKTSKYPSADYFDLKFKTIEMSIEELDRKIDK